jgi:hypothetical protein
MSQDIILTCQYATAWFGTVKYEPNLGVNIIILVKINEMLFLFSIFWNSIFIIIVKVKGLSLDHY